MKPQNRHHAYTDPSEERVERAKKLIEAALKVIHEGHNPKQARNLLRAATRSLCKQELNEAEQLFADAAKILIDRNPFFKEYIQAEKNGELDSRGVDGVLRTVTSQAVLFQIKSSEADVELYYTGGHQGKRDVPPHTDTIAVAPPLGITPEMLSYKLERLAYAVLKNYRRTPLEWYRRKKPKK